MLSLALKDLKLLARDKAAVFWVLAFPVLLGILIGSVFGGSGGASAMKIAVVDGDNSKDSAAFVARLKKSTAVQVTETTLADAENQVRKGDLAAYVALPKGYGEAEKRFQSSEITVGADPSRKAEAGMLQGVVAEAAYGGLKEKFSDPQKMAADATTSLNDIEASDLPADQKAALKTLMEGVEKYGQTMPAGISGGGMQGPKIVSKAVAAQGAQPASAFEVSFPQALLWALLAVAATFAVSMVQERERGTLVRLRVSPLSFSQVLAGKGLACFGATVGIMILLLAFASVLFHVRIGSPGLMALAILSSGICIVGLMMLLSVLGKTEQAVAGSSWGVLIMFAMFGGGMFPVFLMPPWMQAISNFSPLKWALVSVEGAIWRGYSLAEMALPCLILVGFGLVCFAVAVRVMAREQ